MEPVIPPVTQLTVAYGAGLWIGLVVFVPDAGIWIMALAAGLLARWRSWIGALVAAFAVGSVVAVSHAERQDRTCADRWHPGTQAVFLRLHDAPGKRGATTGTVVHAAGGCIGQLRVRLPPDAAGAGSMMLAVGQYFGGGVLRVTHHRELARPPLWRYRVRDTVAERIRRLYGERAALVEAMVLGRRDDIARSVRSQFADAGLAHLLAISGLHVGILAGWLVLALRVLGINRWRWVGAALLTWGYVLLLGFPTPATRAAAFVSIYAVARLRQRHPSPLGVLAVAVGVVLQLNPEAATAVGAWLSVAAVWGTGWGGRLLSARLRRSSLARLIASSFGAVAATAPITAYAFGAVAPVGLLSNLVAVPLATIAVPGVLVSLAGGGIMASGAGLALMCIERVASVAASLPGGHVVGMPGATFAVPWAVGLFGAIWALRRRRSLGRDLRRVMVTGALASWGLVVVTAWPRGDRTNDLTMHVLDVGQGDAIAIRTPRGQWLVVDGGPRRSTYDAGRSVVAPFLRRMGARRLSAVIVTHGDADHVGGIPAVLDAFEVDLLLEPGQPLASEPYREYLATVDAAGIEWQVARAGDTVVVDSVTLAVIHPDASWIAGQLEPNENSVVVHLSYGCFDALLTGDVGHVAERALLNSVGQVDVLKVGHHGSAGSTSREWLRALHPAAAVISVGPNRFGHPAPEVLGLLHEHAVDTWRTDAGGAVTIRTDGRYLRIQQESDGSLQCLIRRLSRSNGSSSSRNGCTPRPPVISPICSMPSP